MFWLSLVSVTTGSLKYPQLRVPRVVWSGAPPRHYPGEIEDALSPSAFVREHLDRLQPRGSGNPPSTVGVPHVQFGSGGVR